MGKEKLSMAVLGFLFPVFLLSWIPIIGFPVGAFIGLWIFSKIMSK